MAAQSASEASPPSGETPPVAAHPNPVTAQPDQDAPSDLNAAAPQTEPSAPATADDAADDTSQAHAAAAAPPLPESLAGLSLSDPPVEASESQQQQQKQQKQQPASAQHHTSPSAPFSSVDATEHWPIKWIQWPPELRANEFPEVRAIIMQRHNGPCSFIALCNILLLRSDISIPPQYEQTVPFDILAGLVADHILARSTDASQRVEDLFQTIPKTRVGLDVNPRFASIRDFNVPSDQAAEVQLFAQARVPIVHGWLAESQDREAYEALTTRSGDYEQATIRLAQADDLVGGLVLSTEANYDALLAMAQPQDGAFAEDQKQLLKDGCLIRDFLHSTQSQLSTEGLFAFIEGLEPGSLTALFRANHVSVLYRVQRPEAPLLFTLVTDSAFLHAPNEKTVWESLETVEGNNTFCGADLSPVRDRAADAATKADRQLAQQLQLEQETQAYEPLQQPPRAPQQQFTPGRPQQRPPAHKEQPRPGVAPRGDKKRRSCCVS